MTFRVDIEARNDASTVSALPANVAEVVRKLGEPDEFTFTFPKNPASSAVVEDIGDWRDNIRCWQQASIRWEGDLLVRGAICNIDAAGSDAGVTVKCRGWDAIFPFWNIALPYIEFVDNGSFEDDFAGWTAVNCQATVNTDWRVRESNSVLLHSATDPDAYLEQEIVLVENVIPVVYSLSAHFMIPETVAAGSKGSRGLYVEVRDEFDEVVAGTQQFYAFDGATPRRRRLFTGLERPLLFSVPADAVYTVYVRLYCPESGSIRWDDVTMHEPASLGSGTTENLTAPADIAALVGLLVDWTQDEKRNVGITTDTPDVGVEEERHWYWFERTSVAQAISEFTDRRDGLDVWLSENKIFHAVESPRGADQTADDDVTLRWHGAGTGNVANFRLVEDGFGVRNAVTVVGEEGDTQDRETGYAEDLDDNGGLPLEEIVTAPQGAAIRSYDSIAHEHVRRGKQVPRVLECDISDPSVFLVYDVGDRVTVDITDGFVAVDGVWRVVEWRLKGSGWLTVVLNEWFG